MVLWYSKENSEIQRVKPLSQKFQEEEYMKRRIT